MTREWLINVRDVIELALQGYTVEFRGEEDTRWRYKPVDQGFLRGYDYRAVPPTVKVNGFDVPKPLTNAPDDGWGYFLADPTMADYYSEQTWQNDDEDRDWLARGLMHSTEKAAIAHAKAMIGLPHDEDFA